MVQRYVGIAVTAHHYREKCQDLQIMLLHGRGNQDIDDA